MIKKKATVDDLELGNLLFGNSRGNYEVDRKYQKRFCEVLDKAGYDGYGCEDTDEHPKQFVVRPYYWGDDEKEARLPNFECEELGLTLKWYKYPLRDSYSNIPFTEEVMKALEEIVKRPDRRKRNND